MKNPLSRFFSILYCLTLFIGLDHNNILAQGSLPKPDHIVIVILENHSYNQIVGSLNAPYINTLVSDSSTAVFTESYALQHPSQPNYLDLYSGCNQGVNNDNLPSNIPFTSTNLGYQLIESGFSFTTFSENLPYVGFNGTTSGLYARKHNPAANWMGTGTNQIPTSTNQPYTTFPKSDFDSLPTIAYVIPNLVNDMHNGTDPSRILLADNWIQTHLEIYIQWAKSHNSLFILTFDEDDSHQNNHILTLFNGAHVKPGQYNDVINHYTVLRTLENMYGLEYSCNTASAMTITDCWITPSAVGDPDSGTNAYTVYPNPSTGAFTISADPYGQTELPFIIVYDATGHKMNTLVEKSNNSIHVEIENAVPGLYLLNIINREVRDFKLIDIQ